jgi:hypothetical protein
MFKVHAFLDGRMVANQRMEHIPIKGDTVRLPGNEGEVFSLVTEVIHCWDESSTDGQRVNIRLESLATKPAAEDSPAAPSAA